MSKTRRNNDGTTYKVGDIEADNRFRVPDYKIETAVIAEALQKSHGYVYAAAEMIGCNHKTIYRRLRDVAWLQDWLDALRGKELDDAELKLHEAIMDREPWAIKLKLMTQGKDRGYTERKELSGVDDEPVTIVIKQVAAAKPPEPKAAPVEEEITTEANAG